MYERFTDRARKVMQLANLEAQRLNHEYIGTEHVLMGLIKEGSSVAAHVLQSVGLTTAVLRANVDKLVQAGPDLVTRGKLPQTPRTKKVIENAMAAARELNHNYVGTEHILIGLLQEEEGVAAEILKLNNIDRLKMIEDCKMLTDPAASMRALEEVIRERTENALGMQLPYPDKVLRVQLLLALTSLSSTMVEIARQLDIVTKALNEEQTH